MRRQFERPERPREADLFLVVDVLVANHDHGVGRHGEFHGVDERIAGWFVQVGAQQLRRERATGKFRPKSIDGESHGTTPPADPPKLPGCMLAPGGRQRNSAPVELQFLDG